jgi:DNA polymerase III psi subunit
LLWPPSGLENMDEAFKWALKNIKKEELELWQFYYGTWLAGRGRTEESLKVLVLSSLGISKALEARLLRQKGDLKGAQKAYAAIKEEWLQLHPQVVVERDKVLRSLGLSKERASWLAKVSALNDEWVKERQVQLFIDQGEYNKAKDLLLSVPFQKVHQTYTRTALWMQICEKLKLNCFPIPAQLGEDHLATFGAYREFE